MQHEIEETIATFFDKVSSHIKEGMPCRDAIDLAAVTVGSILPATVSRAVSKYQEATHPKMALSQQEDVDVLAFASMGKLWHEGMEDERGEITLEDLLAESLYLILKYAKGQTEHKLQAVLEANARVAGDHEAREAAIRAILG